MNVLHEASSQDETSVSSLLEGLTVVVPVYNKQTDLPRALDSILAAKSSGLQVILVDDGSTDNSPEIIKTYSENFPEISSIALKQNSGAGMARNAGIPLIRHKHVLFFDADDELEPLSLDRWHDLACEHQCDIAMCRYTFVSNGQRIWRGMHKKDRERWASSNPSGAPEVVLLPDAAELLEFTNYPWNKIYRTEFLREKGILFSATPVHNDIFFHWTSLCAAKTILLIPEAFCTHYVTTGVAQITADFSRRRLSMFEALGDMEHFFDLDDEARQKYYTNFLRFKIDLIRWAAARMPEDLAEEFAEAVRTHYADVGTKYSVSDLERMPGVVMISLLAAHDPFALLRG